MKMIQCPKCGSFDIDLKEIQRGKPWFARCDNCGFNAPETEFEK